MKVGDAIAEIMKREGIEILCGYPVNHLLEYAAKADIRPIIVRQERIGLHMADAISPRDLGPQDRRLLHAARPGHRERLWRRRAGVRRIRAVAGDARRAIRAASPRSIPNYNAVREMRGVAKSAEPVDRAGGSAEHHAPRLHAPAERPRRARASSRCRPTSGTRRSASSTTRRCCAPATAPDPADVRKAAAAILAAKRPVIYAGTGRALGRGLAAAARASPNCSARRSRPASAARAPSPRTIRCRSARAATRCRSRCTISWPNADLIFGIGCSFTETNFGIKFPKGKKIIHATLDPDHLNKDVRQRRSAWSATPA